MGFGLSGKLAVQLYTLRDHLKTEPEMAESLTKIAKIGYKAVQLSAVHCMNDGSVSAAHARHLLHDNGIRCVATHRNWTDLVEKTEHEIEFHKIVGSDYVAIGGLPKEYESAGRDGYLRFLDDSAPVISRLKAAGIRFGYHNHSHEFRREGGDRLYDLFVERGGPDFLLEVDTYWVWHAGVDPAGLFDRLAGRVPVIHHKDREVVAGDGPVMAAVGEGNMPWEKILPACEKAGVRWHCVEQDVCRRDPFDCLASSFRFLA